MRPSIIVESDYDGFFESFVERLVKEKEAEKKEFKHETIKVSAGPYRSYVVAFHSHEDTKTLDLDFYSASRNGFGSITKEELDQLKEIL